MCSTDHDNLSSGKRSPSHVAAAPSNNDDDFDDFDPRGTSSNSMFFSTTAEFADCLSFIGIEVGLIIYSAQQVCMIDLYACRISMVFIFGRAILRQCQPSGPFWSRSDW